MISKLLQYFLVTYIFICGIYLIFYAIEFTARFYRIVDFVLFFYLFVCLLFFVVFLTILILDLQLVGYHKFSDYYGTSNFILI